jgi:hypothetical protein
MQLDIERKSLESAISKRSSNVLTLREDEPLESCYVSDNIPLIDNTSHIENESNALNIEDNGPIVDKGPIVINTLKHLRPLSASYTAQGIYHNIHIYSYISLYWDLKFFKRIFLFYKIILRSVMI